ncbi:MAG: cytochrome oxidase [Mesorhizobium sp.]|uniref:FixH family protein n=1 Tax=unclassified Mesorhizobium TaxID=325217 RepID=UPI000FCCD64C|nr:MULTISPECIES: FixH family protein [unclassified Mesorhizobium]RUV73239.1 cytochrome oxidase [Mesorhizobium sp. M5C.F.Cr.IN.023.01.1.1]RWF86662.1 MAG: cytochrome oxidase [Mesorhizobium sp.]RWF95377.1 MAG: cytochrome oxidase [Mesorhizobium sp.]RWI39785.1 MAG: cytochrome oxidase [Mesorhizobium sp.]RWI45349.1 MAG: cytochrome oxidase [Mesorhizobium sp.]
MSAHRTETFTGRHMLLIMLAFFGVIIGVNLTMAMFARSSWTGFVVANSYVASQEFNEKMAQTRAQAALHWRSELLIRDHMLRYSVLDAGKAVVPLEAVTATFRRPIDERQDHKVRLGRDSGGGFSARHDLADGVWLVEIEANAGLANPYRETLRLHVIGGAAR